MSLRIDFGPAARRDARTYARTATRPISARLARETAKAFLIDTGISTAWVPKRLAKHDPEAGIFTMPHWLSLEKALD